MSALEQIRLGTNEGRSDKVIDYVQSEVLYGRLHKGEKLPTERQLSEDMGVSRASVREAIRALEAMGVVKSIQGSGNYITDDPESSVDMALCTLFALNDGTMNNIMQLRIMLEFESCQDAIKYCGDEELKAIAAAADYDYGNTNMSFQARHDHDFHAAIVAASRNPLIKYLYNTLAALFDVYREKVFTATFARSENDITKRDHFLIAEALLARDSGAVYKALSDHMYLNKDYLEVLDLKYKYLLP